MNFNISVLALERTTKPTAKGSYQQLEVSYKNLDNGKVESRKLMSFVKPDVAYQVLNESKPGEVFSIIAEKKEGDQYWSWTSATPKAPGEGLSKAAAASGTTPSPVRSTYETPEERAKKQVYIVKQSAIAQAVSLLSVGAKIPPSSELVLEQAQKFVDFVFSEKKASAFDLPNDLPADVEVE